MCNALMKRMEIVRRNRIFENLSELDDDMIKVAKAIVKNVDFGVDNEMMEIWGTMVFDCSLALEEPATDILADLFSARGIDCSFMPDWDADIFDDHYLFTPVQVLITVLRKPSRLFRKIFSHETFTTNNKNAKEHIVGIFTTVFDTMVYDSDFNQIIDDIIRWGQGPLENLKLSNASMIKMIDFEEAISEQEDENLVQYLSGKKLEEFEDKEEILQAALNFFIDFFDSDLDHFEEPFYVEDYDDYPLEVICSLAYTCVDFINPTALIYLIASGKDPEFTSRSKKRTEGYTSFDEYSSGPARNSFEHCFQTIENYLAFGNIDDARATIEVKNIIAEYLSDSKKSVEKARSKVVSWDQDNVFIFTTVVCISDGFFTVKGENEAARFLRMACRLPMELQMILANRSVNNYSDCIKSIEEMLPVVSF